MVFVYNFAKEDTEKLVITSCIVLDILLKLGGIRI